MKRLSETLNCATEWVAKFLAGLWLGAPIVGFIVFAVMLMKSCIAGEHLNIHDEYDYEPTAQYYTEQEYNDLVSENEELKEQLETLQMENEP